MVPIASSITATAVIMNIQILNDGVYADLIASLVNKYAIGCAIKFATIIRIINSLENNPIN